MPQPLAPARSSPAGSSIQVHRPPLPPTPGPPHPYPPPVAGLLNILNATTATWEFFRNQDKGAFAADSITITKDGSGCKELQ